MSQYIHLFARKNDEFVPLYCASRSSIVYQTLKDYAPYEKIAELDASLIKDRIEEVNDWIKNTKTAIKMRQNTMNLVCSFQNEIDEKIEMLEEYQRNINEFEHSLEDYQNVLSLLLWLNRFVDDMKLSMDFAETPILLGLYFGIECGDNVTVNDIVE